MCVCKPGFYFPNSKSTENFFKGADIEAQFALKRKVSFEFDRYFIICSTYLYFSQKYFVLIFISKNCMLCSYQAVPRHKSRKFAF